MLKADKIGKNYAGNQVLAEVSLEIECGEFVAVMGQSGCGKSTLLYCMSGMDIPSTGEILFEGEAFSSRTPKEMEQIRLNKMGFIFQKANFLKNLSIEDNIIFPAFQAKLRSRKEIVAAAEKLMDKMHIRENAGQDIRQVSGGQLQRATICRAMMNHPEILFADEPTGALNSSATVEVMDCINQMNRGGSAVLLVTHDAKVAVRADRIIYLQDGSIKEELHLGRYGCGQQIDREKMLKSWLEKMGF